MLFFLVLAPWLFQLTSAFGLLELEKLIFVLERAIKSFDKLRRQRYYSNEMSYLRKELEEFRSTLYNPDIMRNFVSYPESRHNSGRFYSDLFYRFRLETGNPWAYKVDFYLLDKEKFEGLENATIKLNLTMMRKNYPLELVKINRLLVDGESIFKIKDMESYRNKISKQGKK